MSKITMIFNFVNTNNFLPFIFAKIVILTWKIYKIVIESFISILSKQKVLFWSLTRWIFQVMRMFDYLYQVLMQFSVLDLFFTIICNNVAQSIINYWIKIIANNKINHVIVRENWQLPGRKSPSFDEAQVQHWIYVGYKWDSIETSGACRYQAPGCNSTMLVSHWASNW